MKKLTFFLCVFSLFAQNQTATLSPILSPDPLPFIVTIEQSSFQLPSNDTNSLGLHSFIFANSGNKWLLISGRIDGLHGFTGTPGNFPPPGQNKTVYVLDFEKQTVASRSLNDSTSQLTQDQIDNLSATESQGYQVGNTLYIIGGYGVNSDTGQFSTRPVLTAIDVAGLMSWAEGKPQTSASQFIRQTSHPLLKVAGGHLLQLNPHQPFLLALGQDFEGFYLDPTTNGTYTEQIRPFNILDNGKNLAIQVGKQFSPNPNYRRRDLNVVPIIQRVANQYVQSYVALSGVFTPADGIWTVPILINPDGTSVMPDPNNPNTFKQGMNGYNSAYAGLYSKKSNEMYTLLFGGMSYLYESGGVIMSDSEIPFINSVTTVKLDGNGNFSQYLMENTFPTILSTFANPGNPLFFGAEARFIPANNLPSFSNGVFSIDGLGASPTLLGYIVGGIQSTLANTNTQADSAASPYIFNVYVQKRP